MRERFSLLPALLVALLPSTARAAEAPAAPVAAVKPSNQASPKRARPDYAGRPPPRATVGEALLWIPRVLFFPAYVVSDFVVRRPLGALTQAVETSRWIAGPEDDATSGADHSIGIAPTARLDTDFRASVGAYFHYDHLLTEGNDLRIHAAFGGTDWLRLTAGDRLALGRRAALHLRLEGTRRPDYLFHGLGPRSLAADRARYGSSYLDGSVALDAALPHGLSARTYVGLRSVSFQDDVTCCGDPSLTTLATQQRFAIPAGFSTGYTGLRAGGRLVFDSRPPHPATGAGLRFEGTAEYAADLRAPSASGWVRYGANAGGYLALPGKNRVLSLSGTVLFADPVGARDVPFTELVALGGSGPLSGFHQDRLLGRSAAALALEYRYPIWSLLDTSLQLSLGNVFDAHLRDFAPRDLRFGFAVGVHTVSEVDRSIDLLFGGGTETFAQGGHLGELRLTAGLNQKF